MRENRLSGSEGGEGVNPLSPTLLKAWGFNPRNPPTQTAPALKVRIMLANLQKHP
jgi:hypothetical protein